MTSDWQPVLDEDQAARNHADLRAGIRTAQARATASDCKTELDDLEAATVREAIECCERALQLPNDEANHE